MRQFVFTVTLKADVDKSPKTIEEMETAINGRIPRGGYFHEVNAQFAHELVDEAELEKPYDWADEKAQDIFDESLAQKPIPTQSHFQELVAKALRRAREDQKVIDYSIVVLEQPERPKHYATANTQNDYQAKIEVCERIKKRIKGEDAITIAHLKLSECRKETRGELSPTWCVTHNQSVWQCIAGAING